MAESEERLKRESHLKRIEDLLEVIQVEFRHRSNEMEVSREQKIGGIVSNFNGRGVLQSSMCCHAILNVCVEDIRALAEYVFTVGLDYARQVSFDSDKEFLVRFSGHSVGLIEQEWVKQRGQLDKRKYQHDFSYEDHLKKNVSPIIARLIERIALVGKKAALGIGVRQEIHMESHSINISQAGIVNFGGMYGQIEGNVTALNQSGAEEVAEAFKKLIEAIDRSPLETAQKREIVELTSELSQQAKEPKESRKGAVVSALLGRLNEMVKLYSGLQAIWQDVEPIITMWFQS
ncbi:MAG: hypothetical protein HYZ11_11700 [Candidatus Tectomicrobia bacterium]|uniref:Uncharacterized protein n=1 Tax=Tectimicrobiota bacterium TaxID=2528274 RepID=A0A932MQN3_UNCTE|nr:hypothetical protein [Candidatus Tectomicrobia bacterium]